MRDNKSALNSAIYDEHIVSVLPYYREYHWQIMDLVRALGLQSIEWLDTGCGTGTLAARAVDLIPGVHFTLCDPSARMLEEAKEKLRGKDVRFLHVSSEELSFDSVFDIVTAVQSHHYCRGKQRECAVKNCYRALKEGGIFVAFENIRMETDESDAIALKRWETFLAEHGNTPEDVKMHIDRRGVEVFPITIGQHLELLRSCGFRSVNLLWTAYLQAGFWAIK